MVGWTEKSSSKKKKKKNKDINNTGEKRLEGKIVRHGDEKRVQQRFCAGHSMRLLLLFPSPSSHSI